MKRLVDEVFERWASPCWPLPRAMKSGRDDGHGSRESDGPEGRC